MPLRKFLTGAGSVGAANAVRIVVQFFAIPLMARFLSPSDYGLAGMAMPIILFVMMIADSGLVASLVRVELEDAVEWHTCFWLTLGLGIAAAGLLALAAPLIAILLDQPLLQEMIPALATILPLQMLCSVPGAALQRNGHFQLTAVIEVVTIFCSIAVGLVCAWLAMGVWALILQQISYYFVRCICTFFASDYRPARSFQMAKIVSHIKFGRAILLTNLIGFANRSLEASAIGRVLGAETFGIYTMALQFARLPGLLITGPINSVLYPHISKIRGNLDAVRSLFILTSSMLALVFFPAVAITAAAISPIFHLLLSDKWTDVGVVFQLLAPSIAVQCISSCVNVFTMAIGRTDIQVRLASRLAMLWLSSLAASVWFGIHVVAICYSGCIVVMFAVTLSQVLPMLKCSLSAYLKCLRAPVLVAAIDLAIYLTAKTVLQLGGWDSVILATATVIISLLVSLRVRWAGLVDQFYTVSELAT